MTSRVEMSTSTSVLSESEVVIALGSRTTILHPEIKRHRAWWQEILRSRVEEKLAERVSSPAASAKDSSSLLVDGQGHAHVRLLEKVAVLLSSQGEDGVFVSLREAAAGVGKGAGPDLDLESKELAALLCGYGGEAGTTRLLWTAAAGADKGTSKGKGKPRQHGFGGAAAASSLAEKISSDKVRALGLHVVEAEVGGGSGFIQTFTVKAYEIKHRPAEQQPAAESGAGDVRNAGDGQDSNSSSTNGAGRVVLHFCYDLPAAAAQLAAQLERVRAWNERHRACFLPVAWAVCATLAAKWPRERMNGASPSPTHQPNEPGAKRLSPFSLLALLAAFFDRESASRGVSKDIFGVGENPTFGQRNPNLAEIFLEFCTFVRRLGGVHATTATLEVLEGGEARTAFDGEPKALSPSPFPGHSSALHHSKEAARVLEEGTGPISLVVEGNLREDLLDAHLASRLRRACRDVELSLTPDRVRGLPVWSQDIRWSLLGHTLAPARSAAPGPAPPSAECRPCYLEWMEVKLQMCMNEEIDALPGLYGYHVTGRRRPSLAPTSQRGAQGGGAMVNEAAAADVERCRSVDSAFAAAMEAEAAVGKRERGGRDREIKDAGAEDNDVAMGGASSDSLCGTDDEDIDGTPMIQEVQPPHATPPCSDEGLAPPISSLRSPASNAEPGKHGGSGATDLTGKDLVVTDAGDVGVARTSGVSASVADAGKINAVLARGDRVSKAVAKAVAAAAAKAGGAGGKDSSAAGGGAGGDGRGDRIPDEKSKEEGERARTKALAKERGRERGKQRERERVAEAEAAKEKAREEEAARERRRRKREDQDRMWAERRDERVWKDKAYSDVDGGKPVDGRRAVDRDTASRSKLAAVRARERNAPTSRSSVRRRGSSLRSSSSCGRGKSTSGESDGSSASGNRKVRGVGERARTTRSKRDGSRTARSSRSPSGNRRRTRTGWSDEGRDSNRSSRGGSGGDPLRGSNYDDRSLPPRSNARDVPGKTGEAKEKTQKVAEKEKRKRQKGLPTSTVWSEWRSVSSDDSDDDLASAAGAKTGRGVIRSVTASGEDGGMCGLRIRLKRGPSLERPPEINAVAEVAVGKAAVVKTTVEETAVAVVEAAVAKVAVCATEFPGNSQGHRATTAAGGSASEGQQQSEGGNSDVNKARGKNTPSREQSRRGGAGDSRRTSSPSNSRARGRSPRSGDDDSGRARSRSNSHARERLSKSGGNASRESYRTTPSNERSRRDRGSDSRRAPSRSNSETRGRSTKSGSKVIGENSRRTPSHERSKRNGGSDNRRAPSRSNSRTRERSAKSGGGASRRAPSRSNSRAREMSRGGGNVSRENDRRTPSRERSRRGGGNEDRRVFSRSKSRGRGTSPKNGGNISTGNGPRTPSPDRRKRSGDSGGGSGTIQGRNRLATPRSRSRSFERRNRRRSRSRSCNSRRRSPSGQRRSCGRNKSHSREIRTAEKESPSRVKVSKKKDAVGMAATAEGSATSSGMATTAPRAGEGDNSTGTGKRKVHRDSVKAMTDVDSGEEGELREDPTARAAAASRATVTRSIPRVAVATRALAAARINIETAGGAASSPHVMAPTQAMITGSTALSPRVTALTSATTTGDSAPSPRVAAPVRSATTGGASSRFCATAPTQAATTVDATSSPRVTAQTPVATTGGVASSSRVMTPAAALTKGSVASSPRITVSTQAATKSGTASSPRVTAPTQSSTTSGGASSPCVIVPTQTATTDGAARLCVTVTTQAMETCDAASSPLVTVPSQAATVSGVAPCPCVTEPNQAIIIGAVSSPRVMVPIRTVTNTGAASSFRVAEPTPVVTMGDAASSPSFTALTQAVTAGGAASSPRVVAPSQVATTGGASNPRTTDSARTARTEGDASSSCIAAPTQVVISGGAASSPRITAPTQVATTGRATSISRVTAPTRSTTTGSAASIPCVTAPTQAATTDGAARFRVAVTTQATKTSGAASSLCVTAPTQAETIGGAASSPRVTSPSLRATAQTQATTTGGAVSSPRVAATIRTVTTAGVALSPRVTTPGQVAKTGDATSSPRFIATVQAATTGHAASSPRITAPTRAAITSGAALSPRFKATTKSGTASSPRVTVETQAVTTGGAASSPPVMVLPQAATTGDPALSPRFTAMTRTAPTGGTVWSPRAAVPTETARTGGAASSPRVMTPTRAATSDGASSSPQVTVPIQVVTTDGVASGPHVTVPTRAPTAGGPALSSLVTTPIRATTTSGAASGPRVSVAAVTKQEQDNAGIAGKARIDKVKGKGEGAFARRSFSSVPLAPASVAPTVETQAVTTGGAASSPPVMVLPQAATTGDPALSPRFTAMTRTAPTGGTVWSPRATVPTKTTRTGGAASSPRVMTPTRAATSGGASSSPQVTVPTQVVTTDGVASGPYVTAPTRAPTAGGPALSSLVTTPIRATTTSSSGPRVSVAAVMKQEQDNAGVAGKAGIDKVKGEGKGAFARGSFSSVPLAPASVAPRLKTLAAVPQGAAARFSFVPEHVAQTAVTPAILVVGSVPPGSQKTTGAVLGKGEFAGSVGFEKEPGEIVRGEVEGKGKGAGTPAVWHSGGMAPAVETPAGAAQAALNDGRQPRKKPRIRGKKRLRLNESVDKNPNANVPVLSAASRVGGGRKKRQKPSASVGHQGAAARPPRQGGNATDPSVVTLPVGQATAGFSYGPSVATAQRSYAATARFSGAPPPKKGYIPCYSTSGPRPPRGQGMTTCGPSAAPLQGRDASAGIPVVALHQKQCDSILDPPGGDAATSRLVDLSEGNAIGASGQFPLKGATAPSVCPPQRLDAAYYGLSVVDPRTKDYVTVTGSPHVGDATIGGIVGGGGGGDGTPSNPALQHSKRGGGGGVISAVPRPQHKRGAAGGPSGLDGGTRAPPPHKQQGTKKANGGPSSSSDKSAVPVKRGKNWIRNQKRKQKAANRQPGMDPGEYRAKRTKRDDSARLKCDHPTCRRRLGHSTEECFTRKREAGEVVKRSRHPGPSGRSNISTTIPSSGSHASSS